MASPSRAALAGLLPVGALVAWACAGCLDFDAAKLKCEQTGNCQVTGDAVEVASTTPADQATGVPVGAELRVVFSRAMDKPSVQVVPAPTIALGAASWSSDDAEVVYQPTSPLLPGTTYTVGITGRARDLGTLAAGAQFSFTTATSNDTEPPRLVATVPPDLAVSPGTIVPPDTRLQLTFSEPMSQSPGALAVVSEPAHAFGAPTWNAEGTVARFASSPTMQLNTGYSVTVDGRDLAGNALTGKKTFSFKTGDAVDNVPPQVVSSVPLAAASEVALGATVQLQFSEAMRAATVTGSVTLTPPVTGFLCLGDVSNTLFTCTHSQPLTAFTNYTVTVGTGAQDSAGNALAQPFSFTFGTVTPPSIVATSPDAGELGLVRRPPILVRFSEPMNQASVQAAFTILQPSNLPGSFAWDGGSEFTFSLNADLQYGQDVRYLLATTAQDLQGNALPPNQEFTFKVRRQVSANITADSTGAFDDVSVLSSGALHLAANADSLYVGDVDTPGTVTPDLVVRGLFSFNLAPPNLEATVLELQSATIRIKQSYTPTGAQPYSQNASIFANTIDVASPGGFSANYLSAYNATPVCTAGPAVCAAGGCQARLVTTTTGFVASTLDVVSDVRSFLTARRVSYRLERLVDPAKSGTLTCASLPAINNNTNDYATFESANSAVPMPERPQLNVTYTAP